MDVPDDCWPCHHICRVITSDRGELISDGAEVLASNFDIVQDFCRAYTPEDKGTIERWFRTIKEHGLEGLDGYGEKYHKIVRGSIHPTARLTWLELRRIYYGCVIQYNFEPAPARVIPPQLVAEGLRDVSRIALWKWGLASAISAPRTANARTIYACLLRRVKVSVREDGIYYRSLRFTSAELRATGLLQRAERSGSFTMEASFDEHLGSVLWFRTHESAEWHTAELVDHACLAHASLVEVAEFLRAREQARETTKVNAYNRSAQLRKASSTVKQHATAATPPAQAALPGTSGVLRTAEKLLEGRLHAADALALAKPTTRPSFTPPPEITSRETAFANLALRLFK